VHRGMSAKGHKRTLALVRVMSALPSKADIGSAKSQKRKSRDLFDHLTGPRKIRGYKLGAEILGFDNELCGGRGYRKKSSTATLARDTGLCSPRSI
jgi:hypothetical protein